MWTFTPLVCVSVSFQKTSPVTQRFVELFVVVDNTEVKTSFQLFHRFDSVAA